MPAIVAYDTFRYARGAGGVEDIERIGGEYRHAIGGFFRRHGLSAQLFPVVIASGDEFARLLRPLQDDAGLRLDAGKFYGLIQQPLVLHDAARPPPPPPRENPVSLFILH